ncbi:TMEM175 family protein [Pseudomonas sp. SL4(2022)]|uniref:TMEM175 family protein n=1 Tax=unclassified Pseudomonas TaxID=196821 RepID=UPI001304E97E|nr:MULTISPECIES: TMEM175 family protein [unclassified Pseudomonas]WAC45795.1 TMEM175 family protein [Pseudomonas sp. SL4(2022)]
MNSARLQAFSDGVLAITITILVFNLKPPEFTNWESLVPLIPEFTAHILTFIYVGIYWNNHHHLWFSATKVTGKILWANSHLLFWLSILPMASGWVGKHFISSYPLAFYGGILFLSSFAWSLLTQFVAKEEADNPEVQRLCAMTGKTKLSMLAYLTGIVCAFFAPVLSLIIYFLVACAWLMPDKHIEKSCTQRTNP